MRQFWIALVCLSTLAMALNVVSAAPLSSAAERPIGPPSDVGAKGFDSETTLPGRELPTPSTTMLLVLGLSGLTAVGGRGHSRDRKRPPFA